MKRHAAALALAGLVGLAGTAGADETGVEYCNFTITTLPAVIATQGHWCFSKNLSTAITTGNAVTINVDFVVLDLNNFKLGGGSAGLATQAVGVYARNHRNITVRNGNIRGFQFGIRLVGTAAGNILVENNSVDGNTYYGIEVDGDSSIVRNNSVTNTGGSTVGTEWTYGIYADAATATNGVWGVSVARDNLVSNTDSQAGGLSPSGYGIGARVADHNIVKLGPSNTADNGIWANVCRDNTVLGDVNTNNDYSCSVNAGSNVTYLE